MKEDINKLYKAIKLAPEGKGFYKGRDLKLRQLQDYKKMVDAVLKKISAKQEIHIVESCSGNCFLSFYLAWHYRERHIRFTCIEQRADLMDDAKGTAAALGLNNMSFIASRVERAVIAGPVHVVCSLHACDVATDYTLALGVREKARYILSVSCCQHTMHNNIRASLLKSLTRHRVYKEQMAAMLGDSMRGELLTALGFKTDIFAFTSVKNTGRNILLRAERAPVCEAHREEAQNQYEILKKLFRAEPLLNTLLEEPLQRKEIPVKKVS